MIKKISLLCFALLFTFNLFAAKANWIITGKVIQKDNGNALSFATISLHSREKVLAGTTSQENGTFKLEAIKTDDCFVKISFIGFKDTTINLSSASINGNTDLGTISLSEDRLTLKSAVVTAKVPVIEQKLDKLVMNVSEAISTQGSNALDILKKAPGVSIDPSGNILLNGNAVQVWIDGRPSNLSGAELESLLSGTDGSSIDKIEIISHPSSKYDASGAGGIINIKTRKNFAKGISGSVRGSYIASWENKLYQGSNGTINVNYRDDKSNTSISYNPSYYEHFEKISTVTSLGNNRILDGLSDTWYNNRSHNLRVAHDRFQNKNNIFGFVITGMLSGSTAGNEEGSGSKLFGNSTLLEETKTDMSGLDDFNYINTNLNYTKIFGTGAELTLNADYGFYNIIKRFNQSSFFKDRYGNQTRVDEIFKSNSQQDIDIYSFKADYEQTIFKKIKLESGVKWARSTTDNNLLREDNYNGGWVVNDNLSSLFCYTEDVAALYMSAASQISKKVSLKGGLRSETTFAKGEWISADTISTKNYTNLFPTIFVGYTPNKDLRFGLSYSIRVRRPNFRQLNPFRVYLDANSSLEGNPDLNPQYSNQFSLSLGIKQHFNLSLNGQFTKNTIIQNPFFNEETGEKLIKWDNFGEQNFLGAALSVTEYPISKWLNVNTNIFVASLRSRSGDYNKESFFSQGFLNATFIPKDNYKIELIGMYQSGLPYGYFKVKPTGEISLAFKRSFMDNRGNLSVAINDIFKTQRSRIALNNGSVMGYTLDNNYRSQKLTITLSMRFGQSKAFKQRKVGELEEGSRVGSSN